MSEHDDGNQTERPADPPTEEAPTRQRPASGDAPTQQTGPRRLLRSRNDRVIAGISGGLGRYFDVDPVIIRIGFAVSVLFGGLGVIAYLAAWIFVPADDGAGVPVPTTAGRRVARGLAIAALALAALFGFGALVTGAAFVTGLGYGLIVAATVVAIGIALLALSGRSGAKWLIVPALALSIGVGVAAAADLDLEGGVGERVYRPASAAAIPAEGYELGVGGLAVDLREIAWTPTRVLDLRVRVGAGRALIAVPSDVCVTADAHVGAGELRIAGERADGVDADLVTGEADEATPQLRLDADVDLGQVRVINDDDVDLGNPGDGPFDHGRGPFAEDLGAGAEAERGANQRACTG